jgi:hypothetical protein
VLGVHAAVAVFAAYMLVRHLPPALRALRGRGREGEGGERPPPVAALVPVLNVLLAVAILALAVKGLAGALIRR